MLYDKIKLCKSASIKAGCKMLVKLTPGEVKKYEEVDIKNYLISFLVTQRGALCVPRTIRL